MGRRTKIVATVGPSSENEAVVREMLQAGMDVARLSLAHGTLDEAAGRLRLVRKVAKQEDREVGILVDLPGPKIRLANFGEHSVLLSEGSAIQLRVGNQISTSSVIEVDYEGLLNDVEVGDRLTIGDGRAVIEITDGDSEYLSASVVHGGSLTGCPGLHIPADRLSLHAPTEADLKALEYFLKLDIDMVALSFVRSADDLYRLPVDPHPQGPLVIAKIETRAAIENLSSIIEASGAVMVARGDLGSECSIEELPILQKEIIRQCIKLGRPAITATQMLESMILAPEPTRAEASDVANAVWDGSSALMLSGETAVGGDPANVVRTMARIAERADDEFDHSGWLAELSRTRFADKEDSDGSITDAMTHASARALNELGIKTILCVSGTGFTVRSMARFRPESQILGLSSNVKTLRQLTLSWGTKPIYMSEEGDLQQRVSAALDRARDLEWVAVDELVAVLAGTDSRSRFTNALRIERVAAP